MTRIAVIYYSSTGTTYRMAQAVAEGVRSTGAEVSLRRVAELAPPPIVAAKPEWQRHLDATREVPEATLADLEAADGFVFGTPVRFGLPAAQLKQFIDTTGPLWREGKLQDKAAGCFTSVGTLHGGHESTLLALHNVFYHWGAIIVPPGYTNRAVFDAGGNPYGASCTDPRGGEVTPERLAAARFQGSRIARIAETLARERAQRPRG